MQRGALCEAPSCFRRGLGVVKVKWLSSCQLANTPQAKKRLNSFAP
jgi:hypothetical protein